jgi:hypothetical protein
MFATGNRAASGRSPIIAAVKVLVVWFFLARAILVIGLSNKIPEKTVWTLDIMFFVLTGMYVFVRESVAEGLSIKMFVMVVLLTAGGVGIFSSLPRNLLVKEMAKDNQFPLIGSLHALIGDDDREFINMRPIEHLARATKLIFDNPSIESLFQARRHLQSIPKTSVEFPSAQELLKVADLRMKEVRLRIAADNDQTADDSQTVEIVGMERVSKGWRISVHNGTAVPVGKLQYEVKCFNGGGWQIKLDNQLPVSERVIRSDETWSFTIGSETVPRDTAYVYVQIVSYKEKTKS